HTVPSGGAGSAVAAFPNARYPVRQLEWDYWMADAQRGEPTVDACVVPLAASGHLEMAGEGFAASPSVRYLDTPGHTPGHVCIVVESGDEGAIITGDITHSPAQVQHLDWADAIDTDLEAGERSRREVFDRIHDDGLAMCSGHYPFNEGLGRLVLVEGRRVWQGISLRG
ncbi:MAG: hypothetical protein QOH61_2303, partial [Chloroflexota bacterium]|nr:hypothetical protein [Chloroflexota bacterium]